MLTFSEILYDKGKSDPDSIVLLEKKFMFQKLCSSSTSDAPAELNDNICMKMNHQKGLMEKTLQKSFFLCNWWERKKRERQKKREKERERLEICSQKARGQKTRIMFFLCAAFWWVDECWPHLLRKGKFVYFVGCCKALWYIHLICNILSSTSILFTDEPKQNSS